MVVGMAEQHTKHQHEKTRMFHGFQQMSCAEIEM